MRLTGVQPLVAEEARRHQAHRKAARPGVIARTRPAAHRVGYERAQSAVAQPAAAAGHLLRQLRADVFVEQADFGQMFKYQNSAQ